jgi:hypothetical protein
MPRGEELHALRAPALAGGLARAQANFRRPEGSLGQEEKTVSPDDHVLTAGNPDRWQAFAKSHHEFLLRVGS